MAMFCICGVCIPYTSLIPILLMLWRPIKLWIQKIFGTPATETDNDSSSKSDFKSATESKEAAECAFCSDNTDSTVSEVEIDKLFESSNMINLEEDMDFDKIISSLKPTCVKFTATWCKPCKQQEPEIKRLALEMAEAGSNLRFVSVDVDVHDELFSSLEIMGIPHIRIYQRSKVLETFTGVSTVALEKSCKKFAKKTK